MKRIIAEKVVVYLIIMLIGGLVTAGIYMREHGYTDKNGEYVKGTLEIADEHKQNLISEIENLGFKYEQTPDGYMTFKRPGQVNSAIKLDAAFTKDGAVVKDFMCDIYFSNADVQVIQEVFKTIIPGYDIGTDMDIVSAVNLYNEKHDVIQCDGTAAHLELKPISNVRGVVASLKKRV